MTVVPLHHAHPSQSRPSLPHPLPQRIRIVPWFDAGVDQHGYDVRSHYVETYWLSVLGPSATWLLRRFVAGLDERPHGFETDLFDTARSLGLTMRGGRTTPFVRALKRLEIFGAARAVVEEAAGAPAAGPPGAGAAEVPSDGEARPPSVLAVRRRLPPLTANHIARLAPSAQVEHAEFIEADRAVPPHVKARVRARHLALSLFELGGDRDEVERSLHRWRFHPAMAREAAEWAWTRHRNALEAAEAATTEFEDDAS